MLFEPSSWISLFTPPHQRNSCSELFWKSQAKLKGLQTNSGTRLGGFLPPWENNVHILLDSIWSCSYRILMWVKVVDEMVQIMCYWCSGDWCSSQGPDNWHSWRELPGPHRLNWLALAYRTKGCGWMEMFSVSSTWDPGSRPGPDGQGKRGWNS